MTSKYRKINLLNNLFFIVKKSEVLKKRTKNLVILDVYLNYQSFLRNLKN